MAVTETVSTNGGYKVFSSTHATLATAISEVINELEQHNISKNQTEFVLSSDGGVGSVIWCFMAVCKGS